MVCKNNVVPNAHFHKDWQNRVKTWFNQAGRKERRRTNRLTKAIKVAPRPVEGLFRPVVRCQTVKYNMRVRAGKGFTFEELKAAGINRREARTIGVAVDFRRRNRSEESLKANVSRLQSYKQRLVVFPRKGAKALKGDATKEEIAAVKTSPKGMNKITQAKVQSESMKLADAVKKSSVFHKMRIERANVRMVGRRQKRQRTREEKAKEAANRKKK